MAISDTQKLDFLWKKLGYGVSKTDTNDNKQATNESIASPLLNRGDTIWAQANTIPSVQPAANTSTVTVYTGSITSADITATADRTWKTNLTDWIPPEFGSTYQLKVYIDTANSADPTTTGSQIFAAGSGNEDQWFFDYQSGVLHFIGTNLPTGISGNTIFVSGARYTGTRGMTVSSGGGGVASANNLGTGANVFSSTINSTLQFRSITSGTGISLSTDADTIQISSTVNPGAAGAFDYGFITSPVTVQHDYGSLA
jgi:hypothetical protein